MMTRCFAGFLPIMLVSLWTLGCAKKVAVATPAPAAAPVARQVEPVPEARPVAARNPVRQAAPTDVATNRVPSAETKARIQDLLNRIQDAYFDYNENKLRPDAETALRSDAATLSQILHDYPDYKLTVEGYCDERGSSQYNLALGDARARRAKSYLTDSGIPDAQVRIVSFGKERPVCTEANEGCWQKNRRVHITQGE
jgi:peptidoglycan-associated lipoprotein